jgi:hypothetical protein
MATDARLASLMRVVEVSYVMGARADSEESVEAFNMDVNEIEKYVLIRDSRLYQILFREVIWDWAARQDATALPIQCVAVRGTG